MRIFFQKTLAHIKNSDGKKKTQFQVIKGKNEMVHQISGISLNNNPDAYQVAESIKVLNKNSGKILTKERQFRMKSANILSLLKDGSVSEKHNANTIKKVTFVPKVKKSEPIKKMDVKEKKLVKKVKKVDSKDKNPVKKMNVKEKKPVKKVDVKEKKPVKKMDVKEKKPVKKIVKVSQNNK